MLTGSTFLDSNLFLKSKIVEINPNFKHICIIIIILRRNKGLVSQKKQHKHTAHHHTYIGNKQQNTTQKPKKYRLEPRRS